MDWLAGLLAVCRWEGPKGQVIGENGRIKVKDSTHLIISDVDTTDSGDYACVIENMAATKSGKFTLVVSGIITHSL